MAKSQVTSRKPHDSRNSVSQILDQIYSLSDQERQELYAQLSRLSFLGGSGVHEGCSIEQQIQLNISMLSREDVPGLFNELAQFYMDISKTEAGSI